MSRPVTVLAVDDQAVFLRTARSLIAAAQGFEQVGEASSGQEALELASELHPDLLLVDVRMPGMNGIETARRLSKLDPTAVILLMSLDPLPACAGSIESVGARAHVRKQELSPRRLRALWDAHRPAAYASSLVRPSRSRTPHPRG